MWGVVGGVDRVLDGEFVCGWLGGGVFVWGWGWCMGCLFDCVCGGEGVCGVGLVVGGRVVVGVGRVGVVRGGVGVVGGVCCQSRVGWGWACGCVGVGEWRIGVCVVEVFGWGAGGCGGEVFWLWGLELGDARLWFVGVVCVGDAFMGLALGSRGRMVWDGVAGGLRICGKSWGLFVGCGWLVGSCGIRVFWWFVVGGGFGCVRRGGVVGICIGAEYRGFCGVIYASCGVVVEVWLFGASSSVGMVGWTAGQVVVVDIEVVGWVVEGCGGIVVCVEDEGLVGDEIEISGKLWVGGFRLRGLCVVGNVYVGGVLVGVRRLMGCYGAFGGARGLGSGLRCVDAGSEWYCRCVGVMYDCMGGRDGRGVGIAGIGGGTDGLECGVEALGTWGWVRVGCVDGWGCWGEGDGVLGDWLGVYGGSEMAKVGGVVGVGGCRGWCVVGWGVWVEFCVAKGLGVEFRICAVSDRCVLDVVVGVVGGMDGGGLGYFCVDYAKISVGGCGWGDSWVIVGRVVCLVVVGWCGDIGSGGCGFVGFVVDSGLGCDWGCVALLWHVLVVVGGRDGCGGRVIVAGGVCCGRVVCVLRVVGGVVVGWEVGGGVVRSGKSEWVWRGWYLQAGLSVWVRCVCALGKVNAVGVGVVGVSGERCCDVGLSVVEVDVLVVGVLRGRHGLVVGSGVYGVEGG
ncbi:hypothetical protein Tco_0216088 [Tanacetum coccineum]